jgi:hypothetical protein
MMKKLVVLVVAGVLVGMSGVISSGTSPLKNVGTATGRVTKEVSPFSSDIFRILPPREEPRLQSPVIHFPLPGEVFRPGDIVEVNGTASMPNFQYYTLAWGIGVTPTEWFTDGVTLVNDGTMEIVNGTLGFWDTSSIINADFYTILLTVHLMDAEECSVNVSIYVDPTLHPNFPFGWPHQIKGSQVAIWSPVALADINHDGIQELGFGTVTIDAAGDNNNDYVMDPTGTVLPGWPIPIYSIQGSSLTFADVDTSTTALEVIGGMWGTQLFVWYHDGTLVDGWPKSVAAARSSVAISDLDGDGDVELVLPSTDGGGKIYAFHHIGTSMTGFPVTVGSPIRAPVAIADITQDGHPEILVGDQNGYVHALYNNGSAVPGWPVLAHDFIKSSPVVADLDGNGQYEIIICSGFTQQHIVSVYHPDGTMAAGWPQENGLAFAQPSVADVDGDGDLEILCGGQVPAAPYGKFYIWHHNGVLVNGWPITFPWDGSQDLDFIYAQPVVGDIDGDADMEIIAGSYYKRLYAWHANATMVDGWPKVIGGPVDSTAALGDLDQDGLVEVSVAGDDGKVYVWDLDSPYNASNTEWPMFQYDADHTGCYPRDLSENNPPAAPNIEGKAKGKAGVSYAYNFSTADPEGDFVSFFIDWGDGVTENWTTSYPSGTMIIRNHTWAEKDSYVIKAKARDVFGAESGWGTLSVTMPHSLEVKRPIFFLLEHLSGFPLLWLPMRVLGFLVGQMVSH